MYRCLASSSRHAPMGWERGLPSVLWSLDWIGKRRVTGHATGSDRGLA